MINSTKGDLDNFSSLHMLITRLNFHFESFWLSQSRFDGISILILIFDYYNIVELNVKNFNGRDTVLKKKYFRVCEFSPFYLSFFCFCFFFFFLFQTVTILNYSTIFQFTWLQTVSSSPFLSFIFKLARSHSLSIEYRDNRFA